MSEKVVPTIGNSVTETLADRVTKLENASGSPAPDPRVVTLVSQVTALENEVAALKAKVGG